jgi:hypothetical protein
VRRSNFHVVMDTIITILSLIMLGFVVWYKWGSVPESERLTDEMFMLCLIFLAVTNKR